MAYKTVNWTIADALRQKFDTYVTTHPIIKSDYTLMDNRLFVWDTMPLRDLHGNVVSINGWTVIFTLTAVKNPSMYQDEKGGYNITQNWEDRHSWARICYWFSRDSKTWVFGGRVMQEGVSPTMREWSGSAIYKDDSTIELYYTCVVPDATLCKVLGKCTTSDNGVKLEGFESVSELFSADGIFYQTKQQNPYFNFRDPYPFKDPNTGDLYMLFEGNIAGVRGEHIISEDETGTFPFTPFSLGQKTLQVGCIGIAKALDENGDTWELLPPLISAVGVNDQLERPHVIFKDGRCYLFCVSHSYTYSKGITGADGLYGFVANSLFGEYQPLNASGLVIGNPTTQPYQAYSHLVMPNGLVTSFIDNIPIPSRKTYRLGGTLAPTLRLVIQGNNTYIKEVLDYGYIPPSYDIKTVENLTGD